MSTIPTDPIVEIRINGVWTEITSDLRLGQADSGGGIHVKRGRPNESPIAEPTELDYTVNNANGIYSPDNPNSLYFGYLGRNTPVRLGMSRRIDGFDNTIASGGWGSFTKTVLDRWGHTFKTYTETWAVFGTAGNFSSSGGVARIQATTGYQRAIFGTYGDCEITARMQVSNRTSEFGVMLRANAIAQSFYTLYVTPGTPDLLRLGKVAPGVSKAWSVDLASAVTTGTYYWFKTQNHSQRFQCKFWLDGDDEPADWMLRVWDTGYSSGENTPPDVGGIGLFCKDGTAVVTAGIFQVDQWLAHAQITKPPVSYDLSGSDLWVSVAARGLLQQLGQGKKSLDSALTRHLGSYPGVPMWYRLEETETTFASSAVAGGNRALIVDLSFAADDVLPGALGVATFTSDTASLNATIPRFVVSGAWTQLIFYSMSTPATDTLIYDLGTTGTGRTWRLTHQLDNALRVDMMNSAGDVIDTITAALQGFADIPIGSWIAISLYVRSSGSNIIWVANYHRPGSALFYTTGEQTFAGGIGTPRSFSMRSSAVHTAAGNMRATQVLLYPGDLPFVTAAFALAANAYISETVRTRFLRLMSEQNVKASVYGQTTPAVTMGPQRPLKLLDLAQECALADDGILMEARAELAVELRLGITLCNQLPLALSVAAGHVSEPLDSLPDDQGTRNDVTVTRILGGSARSIQETGPLNVQSPDDDPINGVGVYDTAPPDMNLETVAECLPMANWLRSRGTIPDPRYTSIHMDLSATAYQASASLAAQAISLDSGDMASLLNTRVSPNVIEQIIQSYDENIDLYDWDRTLVTSPGRVFRVGVLGQTTRLDSSYSEVQATFVAGTDTVLKTQRTDSTKGLWVLPADSPGSFPFDILVSGVRLHVTSISGTSDPQNLTVVQTPVNGIIKTIVVGSPVKLYDGWRLALRGN